MGATQREREVKHCRLKEQNLTYCTMYTSDQKFKVKNTVEVGMLSNIITI